MPETRSSTKDRREFNEPSKGKMIYKSTDGRLGVWGGLTGAGVDAVEKYKAERTAATKKALEEEIRVGTVVVEQVLQDDN
jgi:hypothetical protein